MQLKSKNTVSIVFAFDQAKLYPSNLIQILTIFVNFGKTKISLLLLEICGLSVDFLEKFDKNHMNSTSIC